MSMQKKALNKKKSKGAAMVEYAVLIGAVTLIGVLGVSVLGNKVADIVGTLAVILPGAQTTDDHKIHSAQLIEFTDGNDDTYQILDTHIGNGDTNRLNRNTGLGDSNTDSIFVVQDVD